MKRALERGFATILVIVAIIVAVGGAVAATYYVQKSSDEKRLKETAQLEASKLAAEEEKSPEQAKQESPADKTTPKETQSTDNHACTRDTKMYVAVPEGHALRENKALDSTKIVAVPFRGELKVGCEQDGWYSAEYEGKVGFAFGDYLSEKQPAEEATGDMSQDKCSTVSELYTVKTDTPIYKFSDDGKVVSTGTTVPEGTLIPSGECAEWEGKEVPGYWQRGVRLYSFSDLSQTKP